MTPDADRAAWRPEAQRLLRTQLGLKRFRRLYLGFLGVVVLFLGGVAMLGDRPSDNRMALGILAVVLAGVLVLGLVFRDRGLDRAQRLVDELGPSSSTP